MFQHNADDYEFLANISTTDKRLAFMERLAGLGYWELDVRNRKFYCSDEVYRIISPGVQTPGALRLRDIMTGTDYQAFFKQLRCLYRRKVPFVQEARFLSGGSIKYCQIRASFFYVGDYALIAGTIQDLSELIETKKQLAEAHRRAEKLNKDKSYFLAQASHDLRQPMHALSLYLDLFDDYNLNGTQKRLWEKINKTAENLKLLLNNVLDLSKLDYGGTEVSPGLFNIGLLLSDLGREFSDMAECRNIVFEYSICNCRIYSDAFLVERVLRNLLSNAFKFAREKVSICCREMPDRVQIDVSDDGPGIGKNEQTRIFDEFYRGRSSYDNKADGAGLGLAIVKKIAALLHAGIEVKSAKGKGSVFSFTLEKFPVRKQN